jgi:hypothetical protein
MGTPKGVIMLDLHEAIDGYTNGYGKTSKIGSPVLWLNQYVLEAKTM